MICPLDKVSRAIKYIDQVLHSKAGHTTHSASKASVVLTACRAFRHISYEKQMQQIQLRTADIKAVTHQYYIVTGKPSTALHNLTAHATAFAPAKPIQDATTNNLHQPKTHPEPRTTHSTGPTNQTGLFSNF